MNLANKITVCRLLMTVAFVACFSYGGRRPSEVGYILAVLAGATDFVDGWVARRFNMQTDLGRLLDPLCDKVHVAAGFLVLMQHSLVGPGVVCLILAREFGVSTLREMAASKRVTIPSSSSGKLKTVVQMIALALGGAMAVDWVPPIGAVWDVVLLGVVTITFYSGAQYFIAASHLYIHEM